MNYTSKSYSDVSKMTTKVKGAYTRMKNGVSKVGSSISVTDTSGSEEKVIDSITYPYVVIKTELVDKDVDFR